MFLGSWSVVLAGSLLEASVNLAQDSNSSTVNSTFIDPSQFGTTAPSLAALFSTPDLISAGGGVNRSWYTCTIDARWMLTSSFYDASSGTPGVYDSNPNPNAAINVDANLSGLYRFAPEMVSLSPSFASILNPAWVDSILDPSPTNRSVLDIIGQKCIDINTFVNSTSGVRLVNGGDPMSINSCLEVVLAIYIADAMSRIQDALPMYFVAEGHIPTYAEGYPNDVFYVQDLFAGSPGTTAQEMNANGTLMPPYGQITGLSMSDFGDKRRFLEVRMEMSRWGYGFGFEGSSLIYVGVVVLLPHVLLCLAFILWILITGENGKRGWDAIGELVVLGMRSTERSGKGGEVVVGGVDDEFGHVGNEFEKIGSGKKRWRERYVVEEIRAPGNGDGSAREGRGEMILRRVRGDVEGKDSVST